MDDLGELTKQLLRTGAASDQAWAAADENLALYIATAATPPELWDARNTEAARCAVNHVIAECFKRRSESIETAREPGKD